MIKNKDCGVLQREDFNAGPSNLDEVESCLWLGNLTAATDVETLQSHGITHILTIDSCPLPRTITELSGITTKFIQLTDTPQEDLLCCIEEAVNFIISSLENGTVLVHCYFGVSRSAAVVIAFVMKKWNISYDEAFERIKKKRRFVGPNPGFQSQLHLYYRMGCKIDPLNFQFRLFRLHCAAVHVNKVKILPTNFMDVIKPDPALIRVQPEPLVYRCRKCRRIVASASNLLPHISKEKPRWTDDRLTDLMKSLSLNGHNKALSRELYTSQPEATSEADCAVSPLPVCKDIYFVEPLSWMTDVVHQQEGKINCPKCSTKLGSFSWIMGCQCPCSAKVSPAFYLVPSKVEWSNFVQNVQITV